jgi:hypothetical protein
MADFLSRRAIQVLVDMGIFNDLALRVRSSMENVSERLPRRRGLLASGRFRFLLFVGFALFLFAYAVVSPLSRDPSRGRPTINRFVTGLYGGSSVVVLILPVFAFAVERSME